MFEEKTYESLMEEMLDTVDETIDTRQGSVIYDAVAPMALENAQMYIDMDILLSETFADTASYYHLIKRAAERGIFVRMGTPAVLKVQAEPENIDIPVDREFSIGELNYTVTENLGGGFFALTCKEAGAEGNNTVDDVIPLEDVSGLATIEVVGVITAGTDDEDVEHLRERYYASFNEVAFGGNKAEYREKVNEMDNVFGCKVYPVWNGGGTVKLVILGADYRAAPAQVVTAVQEAIDPTKDGSGVGIAPIGHVVTVQTVTEVPITISCQIEYMEGYSWDDVEETFSDSVVAYLRSLRETWEDSDGLVVRQGRIESILLDIPGVDDVTSISIAGGSGNYIMADTAVPIVGELSG